MADAPSIPGWFYPACPVTPDDRLRLDPLRRSWLSLSPKLAAMSELDLLKIILLECSDQKRPIILARCLSRFRSKRQTREDKELFEMASVAIAEVSRRRGIRA